VHGRQNLCAALIRKLRKDAGLSQEKLVEKLQLAGWNIDRSLLVLIEKEQRVLLDYKLKFFLDALGKDWDGIFRKE